VAAEPSTVELSPTLQDVAFTLGDRPVSADDVIVAVLERHREYGRGQAVPIADGLRWPQDRRRQRVQDWFREVAGVLSPGVRPLHGRTMILGLCLVDRAVGRACVGVGLFAAVRDELNEGLAEVLSERGLERLATIPLAAVGPGSSPVTFTSGPGFERVALSHDGRRAVAYGSEGMALWNLGTVARVSSVRTHRAVRTARFGPDRRSLVAVLDDMSVRIWPLDGLVGPGRLVHSPVPADGAALSRNGSVAVFRSRADAGIRVLDTASGNLEFLALGSPVDRVAMSPTGELMAAYAREAIHVVTWSGGRAGLVASVPVAPPTTFDCGAGQVLVAEPGSVLVVFGPNQGRLPVEVPLPRHMSLAGVQPVVAIGHLEGVTLVHTLTGMVLARLPAGPTPRVTFSLDGRRLVSFHEDGEAQVWDVGLDPPPGPAPPASYAADVAVGEPDLLGRSRDVEAFASLIAAKTVEAPLSIGIFGDWGSGKSWFMRQLRARIAEMAAEARASGAPQREVTFYKHIAQVEFNAWHYSESDVLASLVEHIFGRLDVGDDHGFVSGERARRLADLAHAEREASKAASAVDRKAAALAALVQRREEKERLRAARLAALEAPGDAARADLVAAASEALRSVGWAEVPAAIDDLRDNLAAAHAELSRTNALLAPLVQGPPEEVSRRRWRALVQLGVGPAVAVVVGAAAALVGDVGSGALAGAGGFVAAGFAGVSRFVATQTGWIRDRRESLETAQKEIDDQIAAQLAGVDAEITALRAEEAAAQRAVEHERSAYESTKEKVEEKRQAVVEATPERMLEDLISATVRTGEYSRHLGVVAQARRDFEKVSDMIRAINADLESSSTADPDDVGINRIVLYIDDLDRCEADKVAQVLQAVHLLLALPLFVVVVGVDSRWVARALRKQYPELLVDEKGSASAHDYLEKIFQIPFWLDQLDPARASAMLRGLAAVAPRQRWAGPDNAPPDQAGPGPADPGDPGVAPTTSAPATSPSGNQPVDFRQVRELNPLGLQLYDAEVGAMERLAPVIGRSPRTVKRFVNVYRLIKVRAAEPLDFVDPGRPDSDHLVVAYLLAEVTGRRAGAAALFEQIRAADDDDPLPDVPNGFPSQCGPYKRWVDEVARFSFLDEHAPPPA
jgi:hypothetical protein